MGFHQPVGHFRAMIFQAKEQVQKRENRTATPPREAVAVAPPSGFGELR